ncbi:ssDNA-binding transcriptional regulator [Xylariaceae sp. AK1471]|nr:ssDNA-binding transcriptional regulator [Xylariaceae sp. AK1471]
MGRRKREPTGDTSSDEEVIKPKKVKTKTATAANPGKDDEGNLFWPLGGTRRIVTQMFKGQTYVNIREFYSDASGDLKPGKKGIMLTIDQYNALLEALPAVNADLKSKGHEIPDIFATAPDASATEPPAKSSSSKSSSKEQKQKKKKMNIEATSDEEENESD